MESGIRFENGLVRAQSSDMANDCRNVYVSVWKFMVGDSDVGLSCSSDPRLGGQVKICQHGTLFLDDGLGNITLRGLAGRRKEKEEIVNSQ